MVSGLVSVRLVGAVTSRGAVPQKPPCFFSAGFSTSFFSGWAGFSASFFASLALASPGVASCVLTSVFAASAVAPFALGAAFFCLGCSHP